MGRPDIAYDLPEHAHHYLVENQGAHLGDLEDHVDEVVAEMTARGNLTGSIAQLFCYHLRLPTYTEFVNFGRSDNT